jgi:hypothetical protein
MKKIISYCLWGNTPLYTVGAISNAKNAQEIYPDWICRFYIHRKSVSSWVVDELKKQPNVEITFYDEDVGWGGMLYRFYPATEDDVSVMISRDTDSRLSIREKACVDDWLNKSTKKVHTIRDACVHQSQMMGGLWGVRDGYLNWIKPHIDNMLNRLRDGSGRKGLDQDFLNSTVYLYAVGAIDQGMCSIDLNSLETIMGKSNGKYIPNMLSHDDIAFGNKRFPDNTRLPHVSEEMRELPIPRNYEQMYSVCPSCGMRHDSVFIGRDECLTEEELIYLNLTDQEKEERKNIIKYYSLYQKNRNKLGLTTIYE